MGYDIQMVRDCLKDAGIPSGPVLEITHYLERSRVDEGSGGRVPSGSATPSPTTPPQHPYHNPFAHQQEMAGHVYRTVGSPRPRHSSAVLYSPYEQIPEEDVGYVPRGPAVSGRTKPVSSLATFKLSPAPVANSSKSYPVVRKLSESALTRKHQPAMEAAMLQQGTTLQQQQQHVAQGAQPMADTYQAQQQPVEQGAHLMADTYHQQQKQQPVEQGAQLMADTYHQQQAQAVGQGTQPMADTYHQQQQQQPVGQGAQPMADTYHQQQAQQKQAATSQQAVTTYQQTRSTVTTGYDQTVSSVQQHPQQVTYQPPLQQTHQQTIPTYQQPLERPQAHQQIATTYPQQPQTPQDMYQQPQERTTAYLKPRAPPQQTNAYEQPSNTYPRHPQALVRPGPPPPKQQFLPQRVSEQQREMAAVGPPAPPPKQQFHPQQQQREAMQTAAAAAAHVGSPATGQRGINPSSVLSMEPTPTLQSSKDANQENYGERHEAWATQHQQEPEKTKPSSSTNSPPFSNFGRITCVSCGGSDHSTPSCPDRKNFFTHM